MMPALSVLLVACAFGFGMAMAVAFMGYAYQRLIPKGEIITRRELLEMIDQDLRDGEEAAAQGLVEEAEECQMRAKQGLAILALYNLPRE